MTEFSQINDFFSFSSQTVKKMYPYCPSTFYSYISKLQQNIMKAKGQFQSNITYSLVAEDETYWDQAYEFDSLLSEYYDNIRDYYDEDCLYNVQDNLDLSYGRWDYSDCIGYVAQNINDSVNYFKDSLDYLVDNCNDTQVSFNE